jgi:hypothetical protein
MDTFFGLDHTHPQNEDLVLLTTVYDPSALMIVESILKDAEIPFLAKERGTGNSMKIIAGFSVFGTDLYVLREHLETAEALIAPADDGEEAEEETE